MNENEQKTFINFINRKKGDKCDANKFCNILSEYSVYSFQHIIHVYQTSLDLKLGYEKEVTEYLINLKEFYK